MNTEDTVEYNSLRWVKKELDLILHEAQASLSAYVEDTSDVNRLRECIEHLHMVHGTLQMVELYGASQLAEEMEYVATSILKGELEKTDDAYDVLMRAMLQLPDYLESLQAGNKDVPLVLLPLLNDLRTARNASLLSENVLFFPDIDTVAFQTDDFVAGIASGQLLAQAKKLRPHYQVGLLGWLKGQKPVASLKRVQAVLIELEKNSVDVAIRRLWSIGAALTEGLLNDAVDASVSVKMLMGQIDRNIKNLIDIGESAYAKKVPAELLKNLLYYIARVNKDSERVNKVKKTYQLAELLPGDAALEEVRSGLGGLNIELLRTVSQGIREDLLEVKDALEIFMHSESRDAERLNGMPELLGKIGDTLSMIGLGAAREQVMGQREKIGKLQTANPKTAENDVMSIAGVLLSVEAELNNFIASRSGAGEKAGQQRFADLAGMPEGEYTEVLGAVIREALQAFSDARQAILGYLENPHDTDLLKLVLKRIEEVRGAMFMLPIKRLEPQLQTLANYVSQVLLKGNVPDRKAQDDVADVVTSIEYYLEAMDEGRPDLELSFTTGTNAAERLNKLINKQAASAPGKAPSVANKTKQVSSVIATPEHIGQAEEMFLSEPEIELIPVTPATQAAQSAADTAKPRQQYAILGDDADEEILEIFIEESLEELASLSEQYPMWKREPGNTEALTTIRRSFHTLKGSGRLIGAQLIGEFSWVFESLLNRIIDKTRPVNQDVYDVLDEALGVLPQLIEQLKGNREPIENVYELIERAEATGKWRPKQDTESASELAKKPEVQAPKKTVKPEPEIDTSAAELLPIDLDLLSDQAMSAIDASLESAELEMFAVDNTGSLDLVSDEETPAEDLIIDLSNDLQSSSDSNGYAFDIDSLNLDAAMQALDAAAVDLDSADINLDDLTEVAPAAKIPADFSGAMGLEIHMDPMLFQIFKGESEAHLKQIRELLGAHYKNGTPLQISQELIRALHTLFGSARTAEVDEIAELCGELEKYVRKHQELDIHNISAEGVRLLDDVSQSVSRMLASLEDPSNALRSDSVLLNRIRSLSEKMAASTSAAKNKASSQQSLSRQDATKPAVIKQKAQESLVSYSDVDDELVSIFLEEAEELVDSCENSLQRWNNNNSDSESVMDLQRQLHTLKGGARMADLAPIGNLSHSLESLIIAVNEGQLAFTRDMANVLHEAMDRLSDMLARVKVRKPIPTAENLIAHIEGLRRGESGTMPSKTPDAEDDEESEPVVDEMAAIELLEDVSEINILDDDVFDLVSGTSEAVEIEDEFTESPELIFEDDTTAVTTENIFVEESPQQTRAQEADNNFEEEHVIFQLERDDKPANDEQEEVKSGVAHEQVRVRADLLNSLVNNAGEVSVYHARMGQQVTKFTHNLSEMAQTISRLRDQLRKMSIETEAQILSRYEKESDQYDEHFDPLEMDRFSAMQQLSRGLQESVGDMESIRDLLAEGVRDAETLLLQESRVSTELQEGLMRTRMVHLGGLATRLRRIIRQTARELDKDVDMDFIGETNEVDRTVLDRIVAPLEHMLRNAVAHGIELPAARRAAGKPEAGHVTIIADRLGGEIIIKVIDDGNGIDVVAVRKRAIERGMLDVNNKLSDHDILQFIMKPGFSTAEKVTQISGRGVGMDVVDREIKQLGGALEIETIQGKGTTFTIHLPLTLAINHALMVSIGEDVYAIPLNSIEGVVRISGPDLQSFYDSGDAYYEFADTRYQLKHLGKLLLGEQPNYARSGQLFPVLLARVGDQRIAMHVDELMGRREIVVKPVGPQISTIRGISGATILGDGRVVLILEMNSLLLSEMTHRVLEDQVIEQVMTEEIVVPEIEEQHIPLIMVVDDSITIRKVTERVLTRHGMKVITAKDGVDAVAKLQEYMPDVMLLDIEMPRMDGYEVATHVRNDSRLKHLPIIMITSRTGTKHRDKAMEIGVNKYLGKPYQEDDLMKNINELLG